MKKKSKTCHDGFQPPKNVVLISKELNFQPSSDDLVSNIEIIRLRHPRNKDSVQFLYNSNEGVIQEFWKYTEKYRSWFIGNSICSDGTIFLSNRIDPLFLILPYFMKSEKYRVFDEIVHDEDFSDSSKLECLVHEEQLLFVADKKDCGGLIVWKYNEEKVLMWLIDKVNRVANILKSKKINVNTSCAISKTYIKNTSESDHDFLRYSHGIVSEYLDSELSTRLLSRLNLPSIDENLKKRKSDALSKEEIKRIKDECREKELLDSEFANTSKSEKPAKKNTKHVALAKAAVGSKSISAFFKKK